MAIHSLALMLLLCIDEHRGCPFRERWGLARGQQLSPGWVQHVAFAVLHGERDKVLGRKQNYFSLELSSGGPPAAGQLDS